MSLATAARPTRAPFTRAEWFANPKANLLSGLVVALALIPEAISFSIIAGVDPKVGLYASFSIAIIIAFAGGRPGMISAATGAMALVLVPLVEEHGIEYLFAATILAGIFQVGLGYLGVGELMRFVPRTVMVGFVNALAILIFMAQVPHILLSDEADRGDLIVANTIAILIGLVIIYGLPRITRAVPSPLVAIVAITGAALIWNIDMPTVGDMGDLPSALPVVALPDLPFDLETLGIIAPVAFTLALVGLLESLLTAQLLDDLSDTDSDKNRESRGQGVANVATGFLGGMAGCAMIGQSMINFRSGGRTRLSTLSAGVFLLVLILALGDLVARIPMAALVAVMIMVSVGTFDWRSVRPHTIRTHPVAETVIMATTVAIVVITHNLAYGVGAGVVLSTILLARHVSSLVKVTSVLDPDHTIRLYSVTGELFFASTHDIVHAFDYDAVEVKRVEIDLTDARIWDTSAVGALDTVVEKFAQRDIEAVLVGMNRHAERLHANTTGKVSAH
ncbi:MAG: SulP family inorganic anion transporter [Ilumatobacter fluminis]|uniref:SulP family inorganic anion transporter n=1 Tax=Ilumatobacter fluminis TaxID=467091 RepID=UPI0032EA944A